MNQTQRGIFNLPGNMSFPNDKVLQIFTKLKRRANAAPSAPPGPGGESTPIRDLEPNLQELQVSAMNSYRLQDDFVRTRVGLS